MSAALRDLEPADAHALARIYSENRAFLAPFEPERPDGFFTPKGQRAHVRELVERRELGAAYGYVVLSDGEPVGTLTITNVVRRAFQSAALGYWVAQRANGRGIATAAVGEAVERAFGELGLHRLEAGTLHDNVASQRVLEKNGFERIGLARDYLLIAGRWRDHLLFQRVAG